MGEVLARLPCLATSTPAAAATSATVVEILKVLRRSPPVPTTSRISRARVSASSGGGMDLSRRARAKAAISPVRFAFFRQRGQEIGLDRGRNFFVGELFHCLADLLVVERSRRAELLSELFEHGGF